jgi:hypothetical protein
MSRMVPASLSSLMTISLLLTFNIFNALVIVETTNNTLERLNSSTTESARSVSANSTSIEQNKTSTSTSTATTTTTTTTASTTTTVSTTPSTTTTASTTLTTSTSSTKPISTTNASTQPKMSLEYEIKTTWNNQPIDHEPIRIKLERNDQSDLNITITAPFFNDPPKPDKKVGDFFNLWDYEGNL